MPKPLHQEIREMIIHHKKNGKTNREIGKWLCISERSVERIVRLQREKNSVEAKPHNKGRKPAFEDGVMEKITTKIKEQPDITLEELVEEFDLKITASALCRKLKKTDLTRKKRCYSAKDNCVPTSHGCGVNGSDICRIST